MLACTRVALVVLARTFIIVATGIGIAVAQTTIVIAAGRLAPLRCKSLGINGFCHVGVGHSMDVVRSVPLLSATLPFQHSFETKKEVIVSYSKDTGDPIRHPLRALALGSLPRFFALGGGCACEDGLPRLIGGLAGG
jgi:hypothetical protein